MRESTRRAPTQEEFLLCRNDYHVQATGTTATFPNALDAAHALRSGTVDAVVGAIAFDATAPAALSAPQVLDVRPGPWIRGPQIPDPATLPAAQIRACEPPAAVHRQRVADAIEALRDPGTDLAKVVLARSVVLGTDTGLSPSDLAAALRRGDPHGSVFLTSLTAAGRDSTLVGASPEVLIRKRGAVVTAHPLAGSAARSADAATDARRRATLAASAKDLTEHRYVIAAIADALTPLCRTLHIPDAPSVMSTAAMWHLGTPIRGELADPSLSALDLALALHPTPAVCGAPTDAARAHIAAAEGDRGFYAGTVGWARSGRNISGKDWGAQDSGIPEWGDGEWLVTIRCAEVAGDGHSLRTWAGGGIVADSDPDAEVAETRAKLATVLRALAVDPEQAG
ncbi:MAG: chorismate-binding protein [Gordonia sp. (in: high G+C Gram-positive bacteria)]